MRAPAAHMSLFDRLRGDVLAAIQEGATIEDAAREAGTAVSTVKGWLRKGREGLAKYAEFSASVDAALGSRQLPTSDDRPVDADELRLLVSKAARAGNVQAMRLLSELLDPTGEGSTDELTEFDELAQRRQARECARRARWARPW